MVTAQRTRGARKENTLAQGQRERRSQQRTTCRLALMLTRGEREGRAQGNTGERVVTANVDNSTCWDLQQVLGLVGHEIASERNRKRCAPKAQHVIGGDSSMNFYKARPRKQTDHRSVSAVIRQRLAIPSQASVQLPTNPARICPKSTHRHTKKNKIRARQHTAQYGEFNVTTTPATHCCQRLDGAPKRCPCQP